MKLLADTTFSVVSETTEDHPFRRARNSSARMNRNCNEFPQCFLVTPTRQKYPAFSACVCPANCDSSCYRCLRSFRNKIEHRFLDRKLGEQFLRHALYGNYQPYPADRVQSSTEILGE